MRVAGSAGETGEALREPSDAVGECRAPRRASPLRQVRCSKASTHACITQDLPPPCRCWLRKNLVRMSAHHPSYPFAGRVLKGRLGASGHVPAAKAARPLSVQSTDLRRDAGQRARAPRPGRSRDAERTRDPQKPGFTSWTHAPTMERTFSPRFGLCPLPAHASLSSSAFAALRSCVLKPSVNQP